MHNAPGKVLICQPLLLNRNNDYPNRKTTMSHDLSAKYDRWLRAAYLYYIDTEGADTGMHDIEWDAIGRELYAVRSKLPADQFPVLHDERYSGGSLFWLRKDQYPAHIRAESPAQVPDSPALPS